MESQVSRVREIGSQAYAVTKSGGSPERKKDQPQFFLNEKNEDKKEETVKTEGSGEAASEAGTALDLDVANATEGESGSQLNLLA